MTVDELFNIQGRTAVVTGGSIGLGKQMAEGLAEKGCNVVIANRDVSRGEQTARELADRFGVSSLALQLDVTSLESVETFKKELSTQVSDVDILVNSAGISLNTPLELSQESVDTFRNILEVNVTGIFRCTAAIAPFMIKKGSGRVINISSIYGANGIDRSLYVEDLDSDFTLHGYAASKGAVCNLTRDLASSLGRHGITVNAILPATFITDQNRHLFQGDVLRRIEQRTPLGRVGSEDDLKGVVVFLASDASKYVTGQMLGVDGGWLAW